MCLDSQGQHLLQGLCLSGDNTTHECSRRISASVSSSVGKVVSLPLDSAAYNPGSQVGAPVVQHAISSYASIADFVTDTATEKTHGGRQGGGLRKLKRE